MKTINNRKLAVEIAGAGETVIMIHGLGGTANVWGAQLPAQAQKFRVIRYDLEGSGRSPATSVLSVVGWVDDLEALMETEGLTKARIIAHSLGTQDAEGYARSCEAVAGAQPADLSRIAFPLLLIAGEDDTVSAPQISQSLAQSLPHARVTVLGACGHWLPIERPREVTQALLEFL